MITVKVPESHDHAMSFKGAVPTGYGLGKAGWVTIPVGGLGGDDAEVLHDFVEESYRTIAPKKLIKELDGQSEARIGLGKADDRTSSTRFALARTPGWRTTASASLSDRSARLSIRLRVRRPGRRAAAPGRPTATSDRPRRVPRLRRRAPPAGIAPTG